MGLNLWDGINYFCCESRVAGGNNAWMEEGGGGQDRVGVYQVIIVT